MIHKNMDCNYLAHLFMDKRSTIVERLQALLDGRDKYPWGQSIGVGKGVIDGMTRTGSLPGADTLGAIARCENARIDWLVEGRGAPYNTSCVPSDDVGAELLGELLQEDGWDLTIVTDNEKIALVLDQAGSFDVKDGKTDDGVQRWRSVQYAIVELLVGRIGRLTLDLVRSQKFVSLSYVDRDVMTRLERGRIGTYRLLQHPDAVLRNAQRIDAQHPIYESVNQQQLFPATKDEAVLLDHYRAMTEANRHAVNQVVKSMEKFGKAGG